MVTAGRVGLGRLLRWDRVGWRSILLTCFLLTGWCSGALAASPSSSLQVELLRFPYPYRAAVTVCSDTHRATPERFEAVHTLINSTARIEPGSATWTELFPDPEMLRNERWLHGIDGFGFPFGDTMWLYDPSIGVFDRFDEEAGLPVPHTHADGRDFRDIVGGWIRRGWVDSLHTGGPMGLSREAIEAGLRWLTAKRDRQLAVWVNHFHPVTPSNIEPDVLVGLPIVAKNLIKVPLKLLQSVGVKLQVSGPWRFPPGQRLLGWLLSVALLGSLAWLAACLLLRRMRTRRNVLFGALPLGLTVGVLLQLPMRYAQGDNPGSRYYNLDLVRAAGFRFFWLIEDGGIFDGLEGQLAAPDASWNGRPSVLRVATVDDGSRILVFPRTYKGRGGGKSLELLTEEALGELAKRGAAGILYTHWTHAAHDVFTSRGLEGLERLRSHHETGRVWVAPTSRLLHFEFIRTFLQYEAWHDEAGVVIEILEVADPIGGAFMPKLEDLRGISFEVRGEGRIEVRLAGARIALEHFEVLDGGPARIVRLAPP